MSKPNLSRAPVGLLYKHAKIFRRICAGYSLFIYIHLFNHSFIHLFILLFHFSVTQKISEAVYIFKKNCLFQLAGPHSRCQIWWWSFPKQFQHSIKHHIARRVIYMPVFVYLSSSTSYSFFKVLLKIMNRCKEHIA